MIAGDKEPPRLAELRQRRLQAALGIQTEESDDDEKKKPTDTTTSNWKSSDCESKSSVASKSIVDLLNSSDESDRDDVESPENQPQRLTDKNRILNPYRKQQASVDSSQPRKRRRTKKAPETNRQQQKLQAGLVLEEDIGDQNSSSDDEVVTVESYTKLQEQRRARGERPILFRDKEFPTTPESIQGPNRKDKSVTCRCRGSTPAKLSYKTRADDHHAQQQPQLQPYYHCAKNQCNFFQWAFRAERMQWYRFGSHTGHCLVGPAGFSADDLCQGRVGDCWFLSALAVVAERPDLILRLFGGKSMQLSEYGVVQVNLFIDGYWKRITLDNFLPCLIDDASEQMLQQALQASLKATGVPTAAVADVGTHPTSSKYDPHALSDECQIVLRETHEFLEQHQYKNIGTHRSPPRALQRPVTSQDLAYSKAKHNQLWVPFLEKAYSKSHGCYQAISGGHIAEAFLDLTGAPTLVYNFDSKDFQPRDFWYKLLQYRCQQLPMGCGTSSSAAGIIGMHAYSILDVLEVKNVSFRFFQETGVAHGNVSGFTEYDGTVRLLKIRNPHGKGEWKGDFSDKSDIWEKLLQHQEEGEAKDDAPRLHRTMENDGIFWIDYDSFLMGFHNVDVVLAFLGNHAKSFSSNFPAKKSNHRCVRAFEVSLLDEQPGVPNRDTVELYIMGIQKTRRGASHGRVDRKKSYKVCDLGMLVGENHVVGDSFDTSIPFWGGFTSVRGQMFGFTRNGHYRLILDRRKKKKLVVMPVSFGHPAATDKELPFVLRFVSDAPLLIRELPDVPRMEETLQGFCLSRHSLNTKQGKHLILLEDPMYRLVQVDCLGNGGGTVFLYLCINEQELQKHGVAERGGLSFSVHADCRGMSCRTEHGLLQHEIVAKGKKFEAAWRRFSTDFVGEQKSRLLLVLFQSGMDTEFGSFVCRRIEAPQRSGGSTMDRFLTVNRGPELSTRDRYNERGIFNPVSGNDAFALSSGLVGPYAADYGGDFDEELERALALSRGDLELQEVLERSRLNIPVTDAVLERALETSKRDRSHTAAYSFSDDPDLERAIEESKNNEFDEDLQKAILLSKNESSRSRHVNETVDLTTE